MMEDFYTRKAANEGVELPLFYPDGSKSDHWLIVRGVDSDDFRRAETQAKRNIINLSQIDDEQQRNQEMADAELQCIASLIADWSFDKPINQQNVLEFLREAPQICDQVNRFAVRRADFFSKKSDNSAIGQKQKSNSKKSQTAQKQS